MPENLHVYRVQLRRYLHLRGIRKAEGDRVCCPHPGHKDEDFCAQLIEDAKDGDRISCPSCNTSWDIFDVEGFYSGVENTNGTFKRRIQGVKEVLVTVLPVMKPEDAKALTELTDEELADMKARQREAEKATAEAVARVRAEAQALLDKERARKKDDLAVSAPFRILGTGDDGLTYFIDRSDRLQALSLKSLTKTQLQILAPLEWWIAHFRGSRGKLDVDEAVDWVIGEARADFDAARLRGRGAWREED